MNFPIELWVNGRRRAAILEDLSRSGMFVRAGAPVPIGSIVHAAMTPIPGRPRVVTAGTVVHAIDESEATRLGRTAGIGVRFREPVNARDEQFAATVAHMVDRHIRVVPAAAHKIVIADKHPGTVERLSTLLDKAGFAVAIATTGLEALSACHRHRPDVALIDRALPLLDGFAVLRHLSGTPVILASFEPGDLGRAFELGASDFLPKPFTTDELVSRARRLVRPRVVLRGSLAEVAMPVLLTMLEQAKKTGRLVLAHGGATATIDFVAGRIVDARHGALPFHDALMALLDWPDGTFELVATPIASTGRVHAMSVTHLLLEHAQRLDERDRHAS
jgi:CheY-like chemotaxis protein